MFFKSLLCIILCSKQILPLLGDVIPPVKVHNNSFINDPDSLSMFAKYEEWNPRVINGWAAKLGDVPYQAALKILIKRSKSLYMTYCGAVILTPRKLLSAAHCFEEKVFSNCNKIFYPGKASTRKLYQVHVVAGSLRNVAEYESDGQWRRLSKVQYPKSYDFPNDDIAVVVIKKQFYFNNDVSPIPMASKYIDYQGKCLASGFGRTGPNDDSEISPVLLMVHLNVVPANLCERIRKKSEKFVCTSVLFSDLGRGDSGGPLVCSDTGDPNEGPKGILVGITSGTVTNELTLFTRISEQQSFINSVNSVSVPMYKYNKQSCTAITIVLIYKTFLLLYVLFSFMSLLLVH